MQKTVIALKTKLEIRMVLKYTWEVIEEKIGS